MAAAHHELHAAAHARLDGTPEVMLSWGWRRGERGSILVATRTLCGRGCLRTHARWWPSRHTRRLRNGRNRSLHCTSAVRPTPIPGNGPFTAIEDMPRGCGHFWNLMHWIAARAARAKSKSKRRTAHPSTCNAILHGEKKRASFDAHTPRFPSELISAAVQSAVSRGAFSHSAHTAPVITVFIAGTPLKTTYLQKRAFLVYQQGLQGAEFRTLASIKTHTGTYALRFVEMDAARQPTFRTARTQCPVLPLRPRC